MSPRSKQQFEVLREASIQKILDASLELFGTVGYQSTSMSQIAGKAGVSKGLIYNYFESKEDLLKSMIARLSEVGEQMIGDVMSDDPRETLIQLIRATFKWLRKNEKLNRLIFSMITQIDQFDFIHELADAKMKEYVVFLEDLLEKINFPNHRTEARILATLFDGIGVQFMVLKEDYPLDEIEKMLIDRYTINQN